jgi:MOSC domain-containing protein YiiM
MQGKILELFITHDGKEKIRESVESIFVDEQGIKGDKFYNKNTLRSILITSQESYDLANKNGISIENGSLGENILIDINPYSLVAGDEIRVGNMRLQITQNCTLCKGLSAVNSKLPKLLKNDRGIFARLIEGSARINIGIQ